LEQYNLTFRKRGQIGATLNWIVGFLVVFFVIILFLSITAIMVATKTIPVVSWALGSKSSIQFENSSYIARDVQKDFIFFLNKDVNYNGNLVSVLDLIRVLLISKADDASKLYVKDAQDFLDELMIKNKGLFGSGWIRIYGFGESYSESDSGSYNKYSAYTKPSCNPEADRAVVLSFYITKSDKVVLCLEGK